MELSSYIYPIIGFDSVVVFYLNFFLCLCEMQDIEEGIMIYIIYFSCRALTDFVLVNVALKIESQKSY